MSIGWMTNLTEANNYFIDERLETDAWDNLANDAIKTKALINSYNRIYYCGKYAVPASPSAAQLVVLKKAQCEMSYYIAVHLADEDRRKGIQAQGVIEAGIVKEKYAGDWLDKLPIPPFVDALLEDFKTEKSFFIVDIDRDEDKSVSEDVVDL